MANVPWSWIPWALVIPFTAWTTFKKLTSDHEVTEGSFFHAHFLMTAMMPLIFGLIVLLDADAYEGPHRVPVGLASLALGIVMFAAEVRDSTHVRTEPVEDDEEEQVGVPSTRIHDGAEGPRACEPGPRH